MNISKIIITKKDVVNGHIKINIINYITKLTKNKHIILKILYDSTLKYIPHIEGIIKLDCSNCPIKYIPDIDSLLILNCTNCSGLKRIPYLRNIRKMYIDNSTFSYFFNNTKDYLDILKKMDKLPRKNIKQKCIYLI